uniref:C-type lectin domain-containing protein n=1 Tax=Mola mola TaxID=94237 RepID=A0A3Q3VZ08_MOLML
MIDQRDHILATDFKIIASGLWFIGPVMKTKRYTKSFIPFAIKLLNLDSSLWELVTFITAQNNWTPIMQTRTWENSPNILIRLRVGSQVNKNWANKSKTQGTTQKYKSQGQNLLEGSCGRCRPGWVFLKSSCYYFSSQVESNTKKNWLDSRADCVHQGGHLLVINNLEEQKGFWIGLTDVATPGTWVWVDNVTLSETMYWRTGQPNHEGPQSGNCAAFYQYNDPRKTWFNGNCQEHLLYWICEKEPSHT